MPRNSDFPDYQGIKVEHTNFDAISYHAPRSAEVNQKGAKPKPSNVSREGPGPMKGVWLAPKKGSTDTKSLYEKPRDEALERAANQDWRNRGLSKNEIIDH